MIVYRLLSSSRHTFKMLYLSPQLVDLGLPSFSPFIVLSGRYIESMHQVHHAVSMCLRSTVGDAIAARGVPLQCSEFSKAEFSADAQSCAYLAWP